MMLQPPDGIMEIFDALDVAKAEKNWEEVERLYGILKKVGAALEPKLKAITLDSGVEIEPIDLTEFYEGRIVKKES